ncbi:MAG: B12-binding domain-containing radical SAM protein [Anaerolineae bacterium]|nr:B12-binding domain-containing radical SAM protein [Anaerolineae bacterium]
MRHKVVLYNPRAVFWTMPLALIALASALDRDKYEVVIVDGRLHDTETLLNQLDGALCLGVTVLTGAPLRDALEVTRAARVRRPDLPVIWGGWHPSLFPEMCAGEPAVTAAVIGQGEETFAEIVDRLAAKESLEGTLGCALNPSTHHAARTTLPRPMRDINTFPRHDYSFVSVEDYFKLKGQRQLDYISSQGCRFRCNFCADPAVYNRGWYGYTPERMVGEIANLWRRYHFTDLNLQDETYFTQQKRVATVAEGFLREGLQFSWTGTLRADQGRRLDDATFALCKRSGLRRVMIGMEAGSQETIDRIQKDIKVEDMWLTAEKLVRHNIGAIINVIVGFPDEPPASVAESLRVARELRAMSSSFELAVFYFKPYPGNPIAERLRAQNYRFPVSLEEWADFDYIGSGNDWLSEAQKREIEHFKFYQRFAYSGNRSPLRWPLQKLSRWRVERRAYALPLERKLVEWLKPAQALS